MRRFILFLIIALFVLPVMLFSLNEAQMSYWGLNYSAIQLTGGDESSEIGHLAGFNFGYLFTEKIGFDFSMGTGSAKAGANDADKEYITYLNPVSFSLRLFLKPAARLNPYLTAGVGVFSWNVYDIIDDDEAFFPFNPDGRMVSRSHNKELFAVFGLGSMFYLSENVSFDLGLRYNLITEAETDLSGYGDKHSGILEGKVGLSFVLRCDRDTDGDGIKDKKDKDPVNPEDFDGFEDEDGAPDLDNDNDGVLDVNDGAPLIPEDIDNFEDEDGIPDEDNDGDGILDIKDKSPNQPEDFDGYQDEDGAPDLDNDMDGILDIDDNCPNEAETKNGFEDEDGCPDIKPEIVFEEEAPLVLEGVNFATSSADLTESAKAVLDKVVLTLVDYPDIKLEIHGYTDSMGNRDYNVMLSKQRAESVMNYLVGMGISPERLAAKGFGPDNPVASNETREGRAKNRRIEFIRMD